MCRHHLVLLTAARWPREGHGICRECQCVCVSVCRCVCVCVFFLIFNFCLLWFVTMKKNTELKKSGNGVPHPTWYTISPLDGNGANLKKNLFSHFFVTISFFSVFFSVLSRVLCLRAIFDTSRRRLWHFWGFFCQPRGRRRRIRRKSRCESHHVQKRCAQSVDRKR